MPSGAATVPYVLFVLVRGTPWDGAGCIVRVGGGSSVTNPVTNDPGTCSRSGPHVLARRVACRRAACSKYRWRRAGGDIEDCDHRECAGSRCMGMSGTWRRSGATRACRVVRDRARTDAPPGSHPVGASVHPGQGSRLPGMSNRGLRHYRRSADGVPVGELTHASSAGNQTTVGP